MVYLIFQFHSFKITQLQGRRNIHKEESNQDFFKLGLGALISVLLGIAYQWLRISALGMALRQGFSLLGISFQ